MAAFLRLTPWTCTVLWSRPSSLHLLSGRLAVLPLVCSQRQRNSFRRCVSFQKGLGPGISPRKAQLAAMLLYFSLTGGIYPVMRPPPCQRACMHCPACLPTVLHHPLFCRLWHSRCSTRRWGICSSRSCAPSSRQALHSPHLPTNNYPSTPPPGYVASAYATTVARRTVVLMLVESSWAGAGDLLKRFEAFNTMVLQGVNDGTVMPASKLESIRSSMLSGFEKPIQNIGGMASILEGIIKEYDGDFNAEKKKKLILERMTRDTIVQVANKVLHPNNKRRFAVLYSPDGVPTDTTPDPYALFTNGTGTFQAKPKYSCDICVTGCSPPPAPHNQTHSNQTQRS